MARRKSNKLYKDTEKLVNMLIYECTGGVAGNDYAEEGKERKLVAVPLPERKAVAELALKTLAIKAKLAPEDDNNGLDLMREMMNGKSGTTVSGAGDAADSE